MRLTQVQRDVLTDIRLHPGIHAVDGRQSKTYKALMLRGLIQHELRGYGVTDKGAALADALLKGKP